MQEAALGGIGKMEQKSENWLAIVGLAVSLDGYGYEWTKWDPKVCSNYHTIAFISQGSKEMLKILQAKLQQYVNHKLPDVQAGFRKDRGTTNQIANIRWIIENIGEFQKNIYFCFTDYVKAFDGVDHNKLWTILKEMGIPDLPAASWETCMQVRKQQLKLDMEQQTGSK